MFVKSIFPSLLIALVVSGCQRSSPDPIPLFLDVRQQVQMRSGQDITWNVLTENEDQLSCYIDQILSKEMKLDDLIRVSLLNNPKLQAAFEELGIVQAELVQSELLQNPIFDGSFRFNFSASKIDMGLLENFLEILLKPLKRKMAQAEIEIAKRRIEGIVLELIAQATIDFFSYQSQECIYSLKKEVLELDSIAFEIGKNLHHAGNFIDLNLAELQFRFEKTKLELASMELSLKEEREKLNALMGLDRDENGWILSPESNPPPPLEIDLQEAECLTLDMSLDLEMMRIQIKKTAISGGIALREDIFQELGGGIDSEKEADGKWYVGPRIAFGIPIFDWGQAIHQKNRHRISQLIYEYIALSTDLRANSRIAFHRAASSYQQYLDSEKRLLPLANKLMELNQLQYNAMQIGVFSLLEAKQHEIEACIFHLKLLAEYRARKAELDLLLSGKIFGHLFHSPANQPVPR